jgi:hypothetical protein
LFIADLRIRNQEEGKLSAVCSSGGARFSRSRQSGIRFHEKKVHTHTTTREERCRSRPVVVAGVERVKKRRRETSLPLRGVIQRHDEKIVV